MSTRSNILVRYNVGGRGLEEKVHQYYHHCDGYPEWMGVVLDSFITSAQVCGKSGETVDFVFKMLLNSEGHFEDEGYYKGLHSDIEYVWYVDLINFKLTYTEIKIYDLIPFDDPKADDLLKQLKSAEKGEIEFKTDIVK